MNKKQKIITTLVAFLSACLIFFGSGLFHEFDQLFRDMLLEQKGAPSDIIILAIDDVSIAKIGQWPWPRAEYAKLINILDEHPPRALGIDVLFAEESREGKGDDAKLALALERAKFPITLASRESENVHPLDIFSTKAKTGEVSLIVDQDGVVRQVSGGGSFATSIASTSQSSGTIATKRIVWSGKPGTFRRIPFYRLLEEPNLAAALASKIVILGSTAIDLHDEQRTAIARSVAMPGVEIQANLVNMARNGYAYKEPSGLADFIILLVASLLPALCFMFLSGMAKPLIASLSCFFIILIGLILAWQNNLALPVLYPLAVCTLSMLGQLLYKYFGSERSRKELRQIFGKYVSGAVLEEILRDPKKVKLGGQVRNATILFSDIRGFTTLSEKLKPTELVSFLNNYLTAMTDIVIKNNGVVDKYIGDAIMAFWGAPLISNSHASEAVMAATRMSERLDNFNEENKRDGNQEIEIGIGLHTGDVVAGNMGSEQRFDYTVMGDTVNLASRLEGLTKTYGVRIIASEETKLAAENDKAEIIFREIDRVKVKGKQNATLIFQVMPKSKTEEYMKIESRWQEALEYYYRGDWDKCLRLLAEIESIVETDGPTKTLRERCLQFKVVSPANWEGVYEHKSK